MTRMQFFLILFFTINAYAAIWGGKPERIAAAIFVPGFLFTTLVASPLAQRFGNVEVGVLLVDLAMLIAFVTMALYAERFWPLWMSAMQVIQVISHLPIIFIPELLPLAYGAVVVIWSYPMLLLLAIATYRHQQRLRKFGVDRSWSSS